HQDQQDPQLQGGQPQAHQPLLQPPQLFVENTSPSDGEYEPELPEDDFSYTYFTDRRHESLPVVRTPQAQRRSDAAAAANAQVQEWRMPQRLKTVSVSLVLCLNIGVDPPDVVKPNPCARMECWIDPFSLPSQKALEAIGRNLQQQYEIWQPRARYRLSLDPSIEETKKLCCSLRRNARDERILFHYNGHGVPKPTPGGEIWVFNKNYTQYIPVSVYDIQTWLGSPCIFVYDCSNAGNILVAFDKFAAQRDLEMMRQHPELVRDPAAPQAAPPAAAQMPPQGQSMPALGPDGMPVPGSQPTPTYIPLRECIQLAACQPHEILPTTPDLPADLFTCCLTTPIEIALRWFVLQNDLGAKITPAMISKIPGKLGDRRTPLGELNWIFTAITDTIAWNVLEAPVFQKLFRQDLMVAALFRNFLLADRIMRFYKCKPMSSPELPETYRHPMWDAWDLAADQCLRQLPALLESETQAAAHAAAMGGVQTDPSVGGPAPFRKVEYKPSTFFTEQLTAFDVWLRKGVISRKPPQQLPIVLQVLLSQVHRMRALMLLSKFLDLGKWAVNLALSVGIFPYVLRLLQSPAAELKPVLVFIWAKILAVDPTCQSDLIKDNGYTYFINILSSDITNMPPMSNLSEHRAMCAFILAVFCHNYRLGQQACLKMDLLQVLLPHLDDRDPLLRQWACICLTELWRNYPDAKFIAIKRGAHERLIDLLNDAVAEARAAAIAALGALFGDLEKTPQIVQIDQKIAIALIKCYGDASPLVRLELTIAFSRFAHQYPDKFVSAATELMDEERKRTSATLDERKLMDSRRSASHAAQADRMRMADMLARGSAHQGSLHSIVWKVLLNLSVDPAKNVAVLACQVVDKVHYRLFSSSSVEPSLLQTLLPPGSLASLGEPLSQGALGSVTAALAAAGGTASGSIAIPGGSAASHTSTSVLPTQNLVSASGSPLPLPALFGPLQPHHSYASMLGIPTAHTVPAPINAGHGATGGQNGVSQRPLVHRQRPASVAGFPSSSSASSTAGTVTNGSTAHQTIRRSTSFVTSLRSLAGLMVGTHSTHLSGTTPPGHSPIIGMAAKNGSNGTSGFVASPGTVSAFHSAMGGGGGGLGQGGAGGIASAALAGRPGMSSRLQRTRSIPNFARISEESQREDGGTNARSQSTGIPVSGLSAGMAAAATAGSRAAVPESVFALASADLEEARANMENISLESSFYQWSCEYFGEPQMRMPEVDDPGSVKYIEREWRNKRNKKVFQETDSLYTFSSTGRFEELVVSIPTERQAGLSLFHTFEPTLVVAHEQTISVYDWELMSRVNLFCNDNPRGSRISSLQFVNEEDAAMLLTGSDDGMLRLYRKYDQPEVELVSAWRGLSDILPGMRGSGVICRWQQANGYLFTGGDARLIKVWDTEEEVCVQDVPTKSGSQITDLSIDATGTMLLAGFADGHVGLYDRRMAPGEQVVATFSGTQSRVMRLSYVGFPQHECLVGSADGNVLLWDIRQNTRTLKIETGIAEAEMTGFAIHDHGLLVACATNTQNVRVLNLMGEAVSNIRFNEGFMQRQVAPVHALTFHSRRLLLAVHTPISVSVFRSDARRPSAAL
ncbi:Target of rapamycin complex 1 subunit kog1, partial [Polyrhizophydium stewartii]